MLPPELEEMPRNRPVVLRNVTCPYCGCELTDKSWTKEHVIGKRFVPLGTLHQDWNLILRACRPCNGRKSDLEDDISVISMHQDAFGRAPSPEAAVEAERKKINSRSRRTGRPVGESAETLTLRARLGPATMTFTLTAPPQAQRERVFELARLQLVGFFYFLTYSQEQSRGYWWLGKFAPVMEARMADWGNPVHLSFMNAVASWEPRLLVPTAKEHYRAVIRKHPAQPLWSWAVEWNKSYRVVGFFGEDQAARHAVDQLPQLTWDTLVEGKKESIRRRTEVPLRDEDDTLFEWPAAGEA